MLKHIVAFLCISAALSLLGIIFAEFGPADCAAVSAIVLAVYAAARHIIRGKKSGCSGCCSSCANCLKFAVGGKCQNTENNKDRY